MIEIEAKSLRDGIFDTDGTLVEAVRCIHCNGHVNLGLITWGGQITMIQLTKEQTLVLAEKLQALAKGVTDGRQASPAAHA